MLVLAAAARAAHKEPQACSLPQELLDAAANNELAACPDHNQLNRFDEARQGFCCNE